VPAYIKAAQVESAKGKKLGEYTQAEQVELMDKMAKHEGYKNEPKTQEREKVVMQESQTLDAIYLLLQQMAAGNRSQPIAVK